MKCTKYHVCWRNLVLALLHLPVIVPALLPYGWYRTKKRITIILFVDAWKVRLIEDWYMGMGNGKPSACWMASILKC